LRNKNSLGKFISILLLLSVIGGTGFIYLSPQFEQNKPIIELKSKVFWNLKSKLKINISDESGIKYYKVVFIDGSKRITLDEKIFTLGNNKELALEINAPTLDMFYKSTDIKIVVEVNDNSKWNFLNGNIENKEFELKIDAKNPIARVIANSRYIRQGGSGIVVVKVEDANLEEAYITFNDKIRFKLTPFIKENYYMSLIAWDINIPYEKFSNITLVATDKANNKTRTKIPFYIQKLKFKKDTIKISEKFIKEISQNVLKNTNNTIPDELKDIFISQNKTLRAANVNKIKEIGQNTMNNNVINDFILYPFKRLSGSRTAAGYAEKRSYYLDKEKIDEAWHLGMDWASVRRASIKVSNEGKVIFNEYLGIYGNTIIIDHGAGLSTLYAHTTTQFVNVGDTVRRKQEIAKTGTSGAVMGDHLHFGVLIQGIEVNPIEWMDKKWIKSRISDIIKQAKSTIKKDK
jgi:murein DD-endopeptidase MepM/ murein hydrolase activator NlpD